MTHAQLTDILTASSAGSSVAAVTAASATHTEPLVEEAGVSLAYSSRIPTLISRHEAFYWTLAWQAGEQESRADIEAGRVERFQDGKAAIRWLLEDDE